MPEKRIQGPIFNGPSQRGQNWDSPLRPKSDPLAEALLNQKLGPMNLGQRALLGEKVYKVKMASGGKLTVDVVRRAYDIYLHETGAYEAVFKRRARAQGPISKPIRVRPEARDRDLVDVFGNARQEEYEAFRRWEAELPDHLKELLKSSVYTEKQVTGKNVSASRVREIYNEVRDKDSRAVWRARVDVQKAKDLDARKSPGQIYDEVLAGLPDGEGAAFASRVHELKMLGEGRITKQIVEQAHDEIIGDRTMREVFRGDTHASNFGSSLPNLPQDGAELRDYYLLEGRPISTSNEKFGTVEYPMPDGYWKSGTKVLSEEERNMADKRAVALANYGVSEDAVVRALRNDHEVVETNVGGFIPLSTALDVMKRFGGEVRLPPLSEAWRLLNDVDPTNYGSVRRRMTSAGPRMIGKGIDRILAGMLETLDPNFKRNLLWVLQEEFRAKHGRIPSGREIREMNEVVDQAAASGVKLYASLLPLATSAPLALGISGTAASADVIKSLSRVLDRSLTSGQLKELEQELILSIAMAAMPAVPSGVKRGLKAVGGKALSAATKSGSAVAQGVKAVTKGGQKRDLFKIVSHPRAGTWVEWNLSAAHAAPEVMAAAKVRALRQLEELGMSKSTAQRKVNKAIKTARLGAEVKESTTSLQKVRRFIWEDRTFDQVSREYWATHGGANGRSLDHFMFDRKEADEPWKRGFRNAGFNLIDYGRLYPYHHSLDLNRYMGLAPNWSGRVIDHNQARLARRLTRYGIPTVSGGVAGGSIYGAHRANE